MKKTIKILMLCMVFLMFFCSSVIFAETKYCTEEDFETGRHGCKDSYEASVGNRGNVGTRSCTNDDYATQKHNCKNTYKTTGDAFGNIVWNPFDREDIWDATALGDNLSGVAETAILKIWSVIRMAIQMLAVGILIYSGVRYMIASAEQKADIKKGLMNLSIGAAITFATTTVIQFIIDVVKDVI